jgi:hypothetical protein
MLERAGDDPQRLNVVQRAQQFKRSWIELAKALIGLRQSRAFERWGYSDLHDYCSKELAIKAATVDKLLVSFSTIERHAPDVLDHDGVARKLPSLDAVDYFNRALGSDERPGPFRRLDAKGDAIEQLRSAVFEDGEGVRELRERFRPMLQQGSEGDATVDLARKAKSLLTQLIALLPQLEGVSEARVGRVTAALEALQRDLEPRLGAPAREASHATKTLTRRTRNARA